MFVMLLRKVLEIWVHQAERNKDVVEVEEEGAVEAKDETKRNKEVEEVEEEVLEVKEGCCGGRRGGM